MVTNGEAWKRTGLSSFLTAAITAGGMIGYWQVNPPRPDPYTGMQATELRLEMEAKQEAIDRKHSMRMAGIEADIESLRKSQTDLWQVLAKLPPERWQRRIEALEDWALKSGDPNYDKPD